MFDSAKSSHRLPQNHSTLQLGPNTNYFCLVGCLPHSVKVLLCSDGPYASNSMCMKSTASECCAIADFLFQFLSNIDHIVQRKDSDAFSPVCIIKAMHVFSCYLIISLLPSAWVHKLFSSSLEKHVLMSKVTWKDKWVILTAISFATGANQALKILPF